MAWVRIDDEFGDCPKVVKAGPLAALLQVRACCYASKHLSDGFLPASVVPTLLHGFEQLRIGRRAALSIDWPTYMIDAGLWEATDGGYLIHDYLHYNPSREMMLSLRAKRQASGLAGAKASAVSRAKALAGHDVPGLPRDKTSSPSPSPSEKNKNPSVGSPVTPPSPAGAPDGRAGSGKTSKKALRAAEQAEYEQVRQQEWAMLTPEQREARIAMGMVPPSTVA